MRFGILGELEVGDDRGPIPWRGAKRRALVAHLLIARGTPLSAERLIDVHWPDHAETGRATLQTYISQFRRHVRESSSIRLTTGPYGYTLDVPVEHVDAWTAEHAIEQASISSEPATRADHLRRALSLWRDDALVEFRGATWCDAWCSRADALREQAEIDLVDARLELGDHDRLLPELETLVVQHPLTERIWARLALARYRSGRQGDALDALRRVRQILVDELGIEPGPDVTDLELRILDQDPGLDWRPPQGPASDASVTSTEGGTRAIAAELDRIQEDTDETDETDARLDELIARLRDLLEAPAGGVRARRRCADLLAEAIGMRAERLTRHDQPDTALRLLDDLLSIEPLRETAVLRKVEILTGEGRAREARAALDTFIDTLTAQTGLAPSRQVLARLVEPGAATISSATVTTPTHRSPSASWRGFVAQSPELVGRETEQSRIRAAVDGVAHGSGSCLVITGTAGVGKSALIAWLRDLLRDRGVGAFHGVASATMPLPLFAMRDAVRELLPPPTTGAPGADLGVRGAESAQLRRARRSLDLATALLDRAAVNPVAVLVDDLQWADEATTDALELIAAGIADQGAPILLVVAARPSVDVDDAVAVRLDRMLRSGDVGHLDLVPLDESALAALVTRATGRHPTTRLVDRLAEGGGNPLLALAILRSLAGAEALSVSDGRLELTDEAPMRVPRDLYQFAGALLAPLAESDATLVTELALLGDRLPLRLAAAATGRDPEQMLAALGRVEGAGLVSVTSSGARFAHDVLRWVLANTQPETIRRGLHSAMADRLVDVVTPDDVVGTRTIASQLRLAVDRADPSTRARWCERAGDDALAEGLWGAAAADFEAAFEWSRQPTVAVKAGIAHYHHQDADATIRRLEPVLQAGLDDPVTAASAAITLHRVCFTLTQDEAAIRTATEHLVAITRREGPLSVPDDLRARAFAQLAEATFGRPGADPARWIASARAFEANCEPAGAARVAFASGLAELAALEVTKAIEAFSRSSRLAADAGDDWFRASGLGRAAFVSLLRGDLGETDQHLERALELQNQLRFWSELSFSNAVAACSARLAGMTGVSDDLARVSLRQYERSPYRWAAQLAYASALQHRIDARDRRGADALLDRWDAHSVGGARLFRMATEVLLTDGEGPPLAGRELRVYGEEIGVVDLSTLAVSCEIALATHDRGYLTAMLPTLDILERRGVNVSPGWVAFLPRLAARIADHLDLGDANVRGADAAIASQRFGIVES